MNKYIIISGLLAFLFSGIYAQNEQQNSRIVANPMDLVYRFQPLDDYPPRREAADPVCEYFNGKYYMFASKSGGYWSSPDLAEWTFIPCKTIETIENYAPTILIINDEMFFMASWEPVKIYKTKNPDIDSWELVDSKFHFTATGSQDPAFFKDDDGRVYMYWGCSNADPIIGVEIDPDDGFKVVGEAVQLIQHNSVRYGWENPGDNNEQNKDGWNEGPCVIKHEGKYYLQYAAPGTEFRSYADGLYVGEKPLGPFTYVESSPFSFKPGGFIGGAGHGHTFKDKYGNYWHLASMKISQRHGFERRLGLFPLFITGGNFGQQAVWSDYPFIIPDKKVDFEKDDCSTGWNMLSHGKPSSASSSHEKYTSELAFDEQIETWWSASSGQPGEWLQVDLTKLMEVRAIQVNFADCDFTIRAPHSPVYYTYYIEVSQNGRDWERIIDRTENTKDAVHELIVLDEPIETRYVRIINTDELPGKFSIYDLRVFGNGKGSLPQAVTGIQVKRNQDDRRRFSITWNKQDNASGYIINTGINPNAMNQSIMVYANEYEGGFFNIDSKYYFSIDAFNENGIVKGQTLESVF